MYPYDDRMMAVKLYIQYDYSLSSVQHELGYPKNRKNLKAWYKEFEETKSFHKGAFHSEIPMRSGRQISQNSIFLMEKSIFLQSLIVLTVFL